ncbi:restriction endonuclease subunit S [Mesorhizobium sp. M0019]|uniref:restriction endonuclease subunit S n=1 Tax=Mesorhizobium sp. M0019 TaxID=2956845 RepID=UPI003336429B
MSDLPDGWAGTSLGEITSLRGEKLDPASMPDATFIGLEDIEPHTSRILKTGKGSDVKSSVARFSAGDVLYSRLRPYLNKVTVPDFDGIASAEIFVLQPTPATEAEFVRRSIMTREFLDFAALLDKGDRPRVNFKEISEFPVALPPLPEQRRIVAKVEGLTTRTARARNELGRIPTLIARYKQRLLALAFSGELTAGWREEHPSLQTALEKVRADRTADTRLARRNRPAILPDNDIPETWSWISPDEVAADAKYSIGIGPFGSNLVRTDYRESGVRLVFVRDIRREKFEDSDARYVDKSKAAELHQHIAGPGDVLITKMGDPPGDSALFPMGAQPAVITADCIKLTPHDELVTAKYLNFAIRSEIVQSQFKAITAGVAQQKVSLDRFRQLALPIAPLEEQVEIVRRIESAFGWLDRMAADHAAAARLIPKLDAAILAKAFRGALVPQDPNDEPASVLLERIKAERRRNAKLPPIAGTAELTLGPLTASVTGTVRNVPKRARKVSMTKSRQDDDVKLKPYLAYLLKSGRYSGVQDLFRAADLPVADFYKQLAWEIDAGHIVHSADELKAA